MTQRNIKVQHYYCLRAGERMKTIIILCASLFTVAAFATGGYPPPQQSPAPQVPAPQAPPPPQKPHQQAPLPPAAQAPYPGQATPQDDYVWGHDESRALEDADWGKVVRSCKQWVSNRENSQIKPAAQNISCTLTSRGMEQVGSVNRDKTYVTDSTLTAGASNGKGNQRSETSQQQSSVDTVSVTCPIIQEVQRRYRFDTSISCEDIAESKWESKIDLCNDVWLSKVAGATTRQERQAQLDPYLIDKTPMGDKLVDCSTK